MEEKADDLEQNTLWNLLLVQPYTMELRKPWSGANMACEAREGEMVWVGVGNGEVRLVYGL